MINSVDSYLEITSQKRAWEEAVSVTRLHKFKINEFFDQIRPSEIIFTGCASLYYAGMVAAAFWKMETGIEAKALPSSEILLFPSLYSLAMGANPVLVVLSRSGITNETIWATEAFSRRYPGRTVLIGCDPARPLVEMAKLKALLPEAIENTIFETRSWGAMTLAAMIMASFFSGNVELIAELQNAPSKVEPILQASEPIVKALLDKGPYKNIFVLGSGPIFGLAREIGLKCMQMSTIPAFSFPFLESRHGPSAMIDEDSLVIGFYSRHGKLYEAQVMDELTTQHGATTFAVTPEPGWETGRVSAAFSVNQQWADEMLSLAYAPVGQLFAYYCAVSKGLKPELVRIDHETVSIER